jgi:Domain of unknown function (DUF4159)
LPLSHVAVDDRNPDELRLTKSPSPFARPQGQGNSFSPFGDDSFSDDRRGVPAWSYDPKFARDVFTFVRVNYSDLYSNYGSGRRSRRYGYGWEKWATDFPDSDLNFSFRLQQLTSLKVNPDPIYLELTDPQLFDYPFLYMIEPGDLEFTDAEVKALRAYLDQGGFMMVDDFWGEDEWQNFYEQIRRVYPDRKYVDLEIDHPIFHIVYDLKAKPQVPALGLWQRSGLPYERWDATEPHYRAYFDDKQRMTIIICHNTDLGDGWEREGQDEEYFRLFAEKQAYPMGINIVVYAMTH